MKFNPSSLLLNTNDIINRYKSTIITKLNSNYTLTKYRRLFVSKWNVIPLIDRWLLGELIPPLFFAISAFTVVSLSLGVMFDLVRKIVENGLPLQIALQVLILKLPSFLVISFPMAILMATLLAYSRLSANSEIKALRSIGISIKRIVISALILGVFMTGLTFVFNDLVVPNANQKAQLTLVRGLGASMHSHYAKDIIYFRNVPGIAQLFYAKEFKNREMVGVSVLDFSRRDYTQMVSAKKASWNDINAYWEFNDGTILTLAPDGSSTSVKFENYIYPLDIGPKKIAELPRDANNMTLSQAHKAREIYEKSGNIKEARRIKVRIQEKFTFPISCIVFSLIGSSLGCKSHKKNSQSQGFGLSIILILIYYVISFSFSSLGVGGLLNPFFAAWLPVLISFIGGGYLLKEASR